MYAQAGAWHALAYPVLAAYNIYLFWQQKYSRRHKKQWPDTRGQCAVRHITAFDVSNSSDVGVQGESENAQHRKHTHTAW